MSGNCKKPGPKNYNGFVAILWYSDCMTHRYSAVHVSSESFGSVFNGIQGVKKLSMMNSQFIQHVLSSKTQFIAGLKRH